MGENYPDLHITLIMFLFAVLVIPTPMRIDVMYLPISPHSENLIIHMQWNNWQIAPADVKYSGWKFTGEIGR